MFNASYTVGTLSALGVSALVLAAGLAADPAFAQGASNRGAAGAGQAQRPAAAQRPANPASQSRVPQQALDRAPAVGRTLPAGSADGLAQASESASERAREVAPPLGGTPPAGAEAAQEGLAIATEKAADEAKAVASPLGGDRANAGEQEPEAAE
jgi:hypothetical protein